VAALAGLEEAASEVAGAAHVVRGRFSKDIVAGDYSDDGHVCNNDVLFSLIFLRKLP
jgi:hypothetical protein